MTSPAPNQRRSWKQRLIRVGFVFAGFFVLLVGAVAVFVNRLDQAPTVPGSFRVPRSVPVAAAPVPTGSLAFDSNRTGNFEIFTMATDGSGVRQLTSNAKWDSWWPRISPDRRSIIFYRTPKGVHDLDFRQTHLWVMAADGSSQRELRPPGLDGWVFQGHAEWSPDGRQLVMFGGSATSPQIFLTDALGQHPKALTDRGGSNLDPSFTPDGSSVLFVGCPASFCTPDDQEVYSVPVSGGEPTRLTNDSLRDNDPYVAPDGRTVGWLTQVVPGTPGSWDIRIGQLGDDSSRRLVGDDGITSRPQFSADGTTIYTHRMAPGGSRFDVYAISADGSQLRNLTADQPGSNEYPSP